jgi:hypothetical protein
LKHGESELGHTQHGYTKHTDAVDGNAEVSCTVFFVWTRTPAHVQMSGWISHASSAIRDSLSRAGNRETWFHVLCFCVDRCGPMLCVFRTLAPSTPTPTTSMPMTLSPTTLPPTTLSPMTLSQATFSPTTLPPTTLSPTPLPMTPMPTSLSPATLSPTELYPMYAIVRSVQH